jgi:hypothetical protein
LSQARTIARPRACLCNSDSFCCGTAWDEFCVNKVPTACKLLKCDPKGDCAHSLCVAGQGKLVKGCGPTVCTTGTNCAKSDCTTKICNADEFCCSTQWDTLCVNKVKSICGLTCP